MVETLTGVLSNANFATKIRKWRLDGSSGKEANLGQLFVAVDPNCFAPGFEERMDEMNGILRNLPPVKRMLRLYKFHVGFSSKKYLMIFLGQ